MPRTAVRFVLAPFAIVLGACASRGEPSTSTSSASASTTEAPAASASGTPASTMDDAPPVASVSEARILGVAHAINAAAADLARQATDQARDDRIKLHAMVVGADAENADASLRHVAPASEDGPISRGIALDARMRQLDLQPRTGTDFDRAYVSTEVQLDAAAIGLLDALAVGNAVKPEIATALADLRGHVVEHMRDALRIQDAIDGAPARP